MPDGPKRLRIMFFSDWRLQPLDLAEAMLEAAEPVDLILYGGDDIRRFKPLPLIPETVIAGVARKGLGWIIPSFRGSSHGIRAGDLQRLPAKIQRRLTTTKTEEAIAIVADVLARPPQREPISDPVGPCCLGEILELFQPPEGENWLHKLASKARFGLGAVLGNDCVPNDRQVLNCPTVRDLHERPVAFGGWGFVGIEGSIYQERTDGHGRVNDIGSILHSDSEVAAHLDWAVEHLGVPTQQLVVVSHTPPAGCRLDVGLRFGIEYLGSPALADFVQTNEPAVLLCGHCHCRGGRSANLGSTLVVNGASDDVNMRHARAAIIELAADQPPTLTWIDPTPHSVVFMPGIGAERAKRLSAAGIGHPAQLFSASDDIFKSIGFGGMPLPIDSIARYNAEDVLALAHVVKWLRHQLSNRLDSTEAAQPFASRQ